MHYIFRTGNMLRLKDDTEFDPVEIRTIVAETLILRACEIPRSVSKTVNNFFHYGLHLRLKESKTNSGDDVRTMCCYFLGRKCKQL